MMDKRLLTEVRTVRFVLLLTVLLSMAVGVSVIGQAFLLSRIINRVFLESATLADVSGLLVGLAIVILLRSLLNAGATFAAAQIAIRVKADLRHRLMSHLVALGPAYSKEERSGELVLTATEGIEALDAWFRDYLPGMFTALIIPLTMLLFVFPLDLLTFVVLLITAPLIPVFMALIGMAAGIVARRQYAAMGHMSAHFLDVLQGLTTLKLFNRSKAQIEVIRRITGQFRETTMGVLRVAFLSAFTLELLATLSVALVAVEIGVRLLNGGIGFEQALFLLVIAPEYYLPLRALGAKFHAGTEGTAAADRIFAVLETPLPESVNGTQSPPDTMTIRFDGVHLAYEEGQRAALDGISLDIKPGEKVALVGATGSGKTTTASLLLKFITQGAGQITIEGRDLKTLDAEAWRQKIAWVPQSPYLFNDTVAANIRLGQPDASLERVIAAAKAAEIHTFIDALPQGYDTIVGERGTRLSGGQIQRIALARAFLKNAPLVVLDEATSNLDPETEDLIQASLKRLLSDRTALIIAHRLNTVFQADRIIVMENGRIVETGTHTALMAQQGAYHKLVAAFGSEAS